MPRIETRTDRHADQAFESAAPEDEASAPEGADERDARRRLPLAQPANAGVGVRADATEEPRDQKAEDATYARFTPRMAVQLAAPHTWPAAVLPALVAVSAAAAGHGRVSAIMACVLLAICVLMQSSVNTFNDYYDFVKGADTADDDVAPDDATLVYEHVNPRCALALGIGFLVAAFVLGAYVIWVAGWIPLAIGVAGALFVVLYSAGKTPISYLPIGELVSGGVMGGLIPLACYQALTGDLNWLMLLWAVPEIIGVGLIMLTNNTCDIEKDIPVGRRTLPALIGRTRARALYHGAMYAWVAAIIALVGAFFTNGLIIVPFMLLAVFPLMKPLLKNPLVGASRIAAMGQVCTLNVALGAFYSACMLANGFSVVL